MTTEDAQDDRVYAGINQLLLCPMSDSEGISQLSRQLESIPARRYAVCCVAIFQVEDSGSYGLSEALDEIF